MFCRNCGEENPEEAIFCRNCGTKLKEEEIKKATVIETPLQQNNNYNNQQTTTKTSKKNDGSDWISCCLCLVGIFIIFAIIGSI